MDRLFLEQQLSYGGHQLLLLSEQREGSLVRGVGDRAHLGLGLG